MGRVEEGGKGWGDWFLHMYKELPETGYSGAYVQGMHILVHMYKELPETGYFCLLFVQVQTPGRDLQCCGVQKSRLPDWHLQARREAWFQRQVRGSWVTAWRSSILPSCSAAGGSTCACPSPGVQPPCPYTQHISSETFNRS